MFQFIGRVLGVAHNPGYPLYVLLTHAFSYLPIGSLAYRINLFSAVCGAIAVSLMFLASRRLGCGRLVSAGAALGFAFGSVFWSQAVVAEVYTLNAAIVAGVMVGAPHLERDAQAPVVFHGGRAICRRARSSHHHRRLRPGHGAVRAARGSTIRAASANADRHRGHSDSRAPAVSVHPAPLESAGRVRRVTRDDAGRACEDRARAAVPGPPLRLRMARAARQTHPDVRKDDLPAGHDRGRRCARRDWHRLAAEAQGERGDPACDGSRRDRRVCAELLGDRQRRCS